LLVAGFSLISRCTHRRPLFDNIEFSLQSIIGLAIAFG
jgi:hypothetical protein